MIYLLLIIVLILLFLILSEMRALINRKKMNVPTFYVSYDDTLKSSKEIAKFLRERSELCNKFFDNGKNEVEKSDNKKQRLMLYDLNYNTILFLRLCHSLGCEVVIRQIGTDDLEKREIKPEIFAEKVSRIRDKQYRESLPFSERINLLDI